MFLEDRVDLRLVLDSSGHRESRVTTSRGLASGGGRGSKHVTDPSASEVHETFGGAVAAAVDRPGYDDSWIEDREARMRSLGESVTGAREGATWSATLIAFHQSVWVGTNDVAAPLHDVRTGLRYEVVVGIDGHPNARVTADCADRPGSPSSPERAFAWALDRARRKRGPLARAVVGPSCAVFAPGVAGIVAHELVGHALEGDVVARGPTWIQGVRTADLARAFDVIDDPTCGRAAWSIDDEGTVARETVLVEAGRPVGLLLDACAGKHAGAPSTGHGRRASYLDTVRPRMGCTFVARGPDDPEEILSATRTGVFIHRMTAGHTEPFTGRASFLVTEADAIADGRLGAPLAPFAIELNGSTVWSSVDRIGRDLSFDACVGSCMRDGQALAVSVGAPTIRIGVITVIS